MRKFFAILPAVILMSACVTSKTNVTGKSGIDYEKYRNVEITDSTPSAQLDDANDFTGESRFNTKSAYGDAVVTVGTKKFSIGPTAGAKEMSTFQASIDKAYRTAKSTYNPAGFTYAMSPAGSINPLSDVEVQCILSQDSADNVGQKTCDLFFKSLKSYSAATDTNAAL
ncbi:MAG: hypothetical protein FWF35_03670 [Elusimicrobia bacterium]|nr:hypothetical protein [Elusimicrobiota bacterium]